MKHTSFVLAALIGIASLSSTPALAQGRGDDHGSQRGHEQHDDRPRSGAPSYQHAVPRPPVVAPQVVRPYVVRPYVRPYYQPYYQPYYRPSYRPYAVAPYYSTIYPFRPRTRLSFGIFLGYPVPFYSYPYPLSVYGYAAPGAPVVVGPNSGQYGGVSLELSPADARVFVDGNYAGVVGDFNGTRQPLTLSAGRHHIDIDADGYQPWSFDVNIVPGQILPYRGDLAVRY